MPLKSLFLVCCLLTAICASAQRVEFIKDHSHHLTFLGNAKDSLYGKILSQYDRQITAHPADEMLSIERCRFIQDAYYDEYEEYNPHYEETEVCVQGLLAKFPDNPDVLLYASEFAYGDSAIAFFNTLVTAIEENPGRWINHDWRVYRLLAEAHSNFDAHAEVVEFGEKAIEKNDTLDLGLVLGTAYKGLSDNEKAIGALTFHLDSTRTPWDLTQKGRLLLDLGATEKALEAFHLATRDTSSNVGDQGLAEALIENGLVKEARPYLLKDYKTTTWSGVQPLHRLLVYDLAYAPADSASVTYDRYVSENFWNDPLGIYRLQLIAKNPLHHWTLHDIGRITLLLFLVAVILIIPYLWILPLHYFGMHQKARGTLLTESPYEWSLRHFWAICSLWLICDVSASLIFDYPTVVSMLNPSFTAEETSEYSLLSAKLMLFFCTGNFVFTMALINKAQLRAFVNHLRNSWGLIGKGIGFALVLKFALGLYIAILNLFDISVNVSLIPTSVASINDHISSVNNFYSPWLGFLFVVILVPIYEEILFRGVILSASQRNMKFLYANILQSLLFAAVHQQLLMVPFFFTFAMLAGHFRQKTHSLTFGMAMHVTNNLLAFFAILIRYKVKV